MTVSNTSTKSLYQGNGFTVRFDIGFDFLDPAHVGVWLVSPCGAEQRLSSGYTLDLQEHCVFYPSPGLDMPALPTGWKLLVARVTPLTQELNLTQQGYLDAEVLESAYDKNTLQLQELQERLQRCLSIPAGQQTPFTPAELVAEVRTIYAQLAQVRTDVLAQAEYVAKLANAPQGVVVTPPTIP